MISRKDFAKIDSALSEMSEKFCKLLDEMIDAKIDPKIIPWVQEIATILDCGEMDIPQYYHHFASDQKTFEHWKEKGLDICEDENIVLMITKEDGSILSENALYNFANGLIECDSEHLGDDDISRIHFIYTTPDAESYEVDICLDCGEAEIREGVCMNCG
jgi:hypothetical protein